ncbi:hypothetical protein D9758_018618 [Tetrapyrgos nigripes]|uniref:Glycosyl hydrolase family 92 domain-containing protein n=1 Tax=Tetrapyrgos nigripes TaxID=182062 RepID=A0A8H5C2T3_9AGAR|nr:hypothetical protein D9758_018618 [Tetrapyrgos nigripes]
MSTSDILVTTFPNGTVELHPYNSSSPLEICGSNDEMLDWVIAPTSIQEPASHFRGWCYARFDMESSAHSVGHGVAQGDTQMEGATTGHGDDSLCLPTGQASPYLYVRIAADQARANLDFEIPDSKATDVEGTQANTEEMWAEKVGRFDIEAGGDSDVLGDMKTVFFRAYDNRIHDGHSYSGYSIWDTYRAEWALQLLLAPERIPGMIRSMLQDYDEGGWLPMWKNIIAEAVLKGFGTVVRSDAIGEVEFEASFTNDELGTLWAAAWKDASVPPRDDQTTDREENIGDSLLSREWITKYKPDFPPSTETEFLIQRALKSPWTVWNTDASVTTSDGNG